MGSRWCLDFGAAENCVARDLMGDQTNEMSHGVNTAENLDKPRINRVIFRLWNRDPWHSPVRERKAGSTDDPVTNALAKVVDTSSDKTPAPRTSRGSPPPVGHFWLAHDFPISPRALRYSGRSYRRTKRFDTNLPRCVRRRAQLLRRVGRAEPCVKQTAARRASLRFGQIRLANRCECSYGWMQGHPETFVQP
jgi:hypothetical protein